MDYYDCSVHCNRERVQRAQIFVVLQYTVIIGSTVPKLTLIVFSRAGSIGLKIRLSQ